MKLILKLQCEFHLGGVWGLRFTVGGESVGVQHFQLCLSRVLTTPKSTCRVCGANMTWQRGAHNLQVGAEQSMR